MKRLQIIIPVCFLLFLIGGMFFATKAEARCVAAGYYCTRFNYESVDKDVYDIGDTVTVSGSDLDLIGYVKVYESGATDVDLLLDRNAKGGRALTIISKSSSKLQFIIDDPNNKFTKNKVFTPEIVFYDTDADKLLSEKYYDQIFIGVQGRDSSQPSQSPTAAPSNSNDTSTESDQNSSNLCCPAWTSEWVCPAVTLGVDTNGKCCGWEGPFQYSVQDKVACSQSDSSNASPTSTPTTTSRGSVRKCTMYNDSYIDNNFKNWCAGSRSYLSEQEKEKNIKPGYMYDVTALCDQDGSGNTVDYEIVNVRKDAKCESSGNSTKEETTTTAVIQGYGSGTLTIDNQRALSTRKISVGSLTTDTNGDCTPGTVEMSFEKIDGDGAGSLSVTTQSLDTSGNPSVTHNDGNHTCNSYLAELPSKPNSIDGTYHLTVTYKEGEFNGKQYSSSKDDVYVQLTGKAAEIKNTCIGKSCGTKAFKYNSATDKKLALNKFGEGYVLGIQVQTDGDQTTIVYDPNTSGGSYTFPGDSECVHIKGEACDPSVIPAYVFNAYKVLKDGGAETVFFDSNFTNGDSKTFTESDLGDLVNTSQFVISQTYQGDQDAGYEQSQKDTVISVVANGSQSSQIKANPFLDNLTSTPEIDNITSVDNVVVTATTNLWTNPTFQITRNGVVEDSESPSTSSTNCQDGNGSCAYTIDLTRPLDGEYSVTFKVSTGDGQEFSKSISFNTSSQGTSSNTNNSSTTSTADITKVIVKVDGGAETELPLDNSLVDIDLGSLPARLERIVYLSDNTTKEETFYINSDTDSSGGSTSSSAKPCTDTANNPSYTQCAGTTGLEDTEQYTSGHLYEVQPLCENDGEGGVVAYDASKDLGESDQCASSKNSSSQDSGSSQVTGNPRWECRNNAIWQINPAGSDIAEFNYEQCADGYQCESKTTEGYDSDAYCKKVNSSAGSGQGDSSQGGSSGQTSEYTATGNIYWVCSSDNTYIVEVDPGGNGKPLEDENGTCQDQGKTCQPKTTEGYYSDAECI